MTTRSSGSVFAALAQEQADLALRSLAQRRHRHGAIHATRKAIRRLRSLLALCRHSLEPEVSVVDRKLKRLASGLSRLRNAHVVVVTASRLARGDDRDIWLDVASRLAARRDALLADALSRDPDFARRRAQLGAIAAAVAALPWQRLTNKCLRHGMKRSERRAAKAARTARRKPDPVNRHRWRRRLRRLRMQKQMIQAAGRAAPSLMHYGHASVGALGELSDRLGRIQDLHMLRSSLTSLDKSLPLAQLRRHVRAKANLVAL